MSVRRGWHRLLKYARLAAWVVKSKRNDADANDGQEMFDLAQLPLIGRTSELADIVTALTRNGTGVIIAGQGGVGKSRLAQEALAAARRAGRHTYRLAATSDSAKIPFAVLAHLIPAAPRDETEHLWVLRAVMQRISGTDVARPVVLGIDDIHHLDAASAALIYQMATRRRVTLVATMQVGVRVCESVAALWKDGLAQLLNLDPLPPEVVDEIVRAALGPRVYRTTLEEIRRLSAGNPLLLRYLLIDGVEGGNLIERDGMWGWEGEARSGPRLADLVRAHLNRLGDPERVVVELTAQVESLPLAVLEQLCDRGAIASAEHAGLLIPARSGEWPPAMRLQYPLHATVIRETTPVSRTRQLRASLARAYADQPSQGAENVDVMATLRLDSDTDTDSDLQLRGACTAFGKGALIDAERLVRSAIRGGAGAPAARLLATILCWRGDRGDATSQLWAQPASQEPSRTDDGSPVWDRGRLTVNKLEGIPAAGTFFAPFSREIDSVERSERDAAWQAWMLYAEGQCGAALDIVARVFGTSRIQATTGGWECVVAAAASVELGRLSEAFGFLKQGRAQRHLWPPCRWVEAALGLVHCRALLLSGRLVEARRLADDAFVEAARLGSAELSGMWAGAVGLVAKFQGQMLTARSVLQEAVSLTGAGSAWGLRFYHEALLAESVAMSYEAHGSRRPPQDAATDVRHPIRSVEISMGLSHAWVVQAGGEATRAVRLARRAAAAAAANNLPTLEAFALYDIARLGAAHDVVSRLDSLTSCLEGDLFAGLASAAAALTSGDGGHLDAAAEKLARCGLSLHAAELAGAALRAHRATGRLTSARRSYERRSALSSACEDARTPLLEPGPVLTTLTQREREVAGLAAAGRSSREIAELLTVSVRTVDNHLSRTYSKFGITGRSQLANVMGHPARAPAKS